MSITRVEVNVCRLVQAVKRGGSLESVKIKKNLCEPISNRTQGSDA